MGLGIDQLDGIFLNPTPKSVVATVLRELVVFFEKRFFPLNFVDPFSSFDTSNEFCIPTLAT